MLSSTICSMNHDNEREKDISVKVLDCSLIILDIECRESSVISKILSAVGDGLIVVPTDQVR